MILQATPTPSSLRQLRVAFPQQSFPVGQDAEWCVVSDGGSWREFRFMTMPRSTRCPASMKRSSWSI